MVLTGTLASENSLELIELSSIYIVSLLIVNA
jgi:hypothetical protein